MINTLTTLIANATVVVSLSTSVQVEDPAVHISAPAKMHFDVSHLNQRVDSIFDANYKKLQLNLEHNATFEASTKLAVIGNDNL